MDKHTPSDPGIQITRTASPWHNDWILVQERHYLDRHKEQHSWAYVERKDKRQAAVVIAHTPKGELIVIKQFRLPFADWVYELPAGLVDPGESIETAALRELTEETGYTGTVLESSSPLTSSSGLTSETFHLVKVAASPEPGAHEREGSEAIEVFTIPRGTEGAFLQKATAEGTLVDGKLYTWLLAAKG